MEGLFVAEKMFVQNSGSKVMEEAYYECLLNVIGKDNLHAVAIKHPNVEDDKRFICLNRKADILTFMKGYTHYLDRRIIKQLDELIEKIKQSEKEVIFLGDGVPVFAGKIKEELGEKAFFAPAQMNRQKAGSVAQAGKRYFEEGKTETAAEHAPDYLRPSQAERERNQKNDERK